MRLFFKHTQAMSEIYGKQNLISWMQKKPCGYWSAWDKDGQGEARRKFGDNYESVNPTTDDAIRSICEFLDCYNDQGGRFYICMSATNNPKNTGHFTWFQHLGFMNQGQSIGGFNPSAPVVDVQAEIQKGIETYLNRLAQEKELADLKQRNKELQEEIKELDSPFQRVIGKLEPYTDTLMQIILPQNTMNTAQAAPLAIGTTQATEEEINAEQAKAEKSLAILAERIPNLVDVLERLATMPDAKLQMALTFL
jgi:hypothetical protein